MDCGMTSSTPRSLISGTGLGCASREKVGYSPEQDCHISGLAGCEYVTYCGQLSGMSFRHARQRAHEILDLVGMGQERYRSIDTYSTGMRQRAKLAQALVHDPEVIFLDETDPVSSPMKAKGVGELGLCGVGAALANAIYNATGVRVRDYPVTLDKLIDRMPLVG